MSKKSPNDITNLLDYAEREAEKLHAGHMEDFSSLRTEVNVLAAFIISALSAVLGYVMNLITNPGNQGIAWGLFLAAVMLLAYLFLCGAYLAYNCISARKIMHTGINPKEVLKDTNKNFELDHVREELLTHVDNSIMQNRLRNQKIGRAFNHVLWAILVAPAIFLVSWGVAEAAVN